MVKTEWLHAILFQILLNFDSTEKGNIGPVTDALMAALETDFTVVTPALPINGRTILTATYSSAMCYCRIKYA